MSRTHAAAVKVLLVEDNPAVRKSLKLLFPEARFQVRESAAGKSALRHCREFRPDVVLLDITMPRMDGFVCAREIARITPAARIIFLTTHACEEYERAALRLHGAPVLLKKHAALGLLDTIECVLQERTCLCRAS